MTFKPIRMHLLSMGYDWIKLLQASVLLSFEKANNRNLFSVSCELAVVSTM